VVLRIAATPGYFDAIGMTLVDSRAFDGHDDQPNPAHVVMVNETFARHFWGSATPIGKRIRQPGGKDWYQVIGFLRDEKHYGLDEEVKPGVFHPYDPTVSTVDSNDARALRYMSIVLRGAIDPNMLVAPASAIVRQIDPAVAIYAVQTMRGKLDQSLWSRRAYSWLFGAFAIVAVLLAAAGVYGIVSHSVSERTQEIGIRVALGAQPWQVLQHVLLSGMSIVTIGVAAGLVCCLWVTRLLRALLFGVSSRDPFIYLAVILGLLGVGLLANLIPARRGFRPVACSSSRIIFVAFLRSYIV
jgi:ABC-type antimicrobial peptide transport system permease subunit